MFKTALGHLITNSIVFNKKGGKVEIELKKKNNKIYLTVEDTGIGICKEDQKYIFQRFFRGKNGSELQTQGTGLGLYIVKLVIKSMRGNLWFESKENKGTKFYLKIPITPKVRK